MQEKIWSKRAKQEVSRSNGFKNLYGLIFDPRKERKTWHSWGERKKLGYMNLYKRKQGTSQKGFFLAHNKLTFGHHVRKKKKRSRSFTLQGEKEIGLHMEMENKNSSDWKEIESKAGGNHGTLSVYFLYYVVYYFNHV